MSKSTTKQIINKTSIAGATLNDALEWLKANSGGGGGGGSPTGPAGGVLSGTYPNPGFAVDMATQAELDAVVTAVGGALAGKQDTLVSGTNLKTVNGNSLLGAGDIPIAGGGGVTDHGALSGLGDDDHTQYHNDARGDARYEPIVAAGTSDQYWAGNKTWQNFALAVRSAVLTGLSTATNAAVVATDAVLVAIGKLQAQLTAKVGGYAADNIGYLNIPQNSQSAVYTCVLSDAGKHILHPSADTTARTFTIPANASVAFPIGTVITFVNQNGGGVITIAITTDTMRLAGAGTTGSRTLAANGLATAIKVTTTEWIISGVNLT